MTLYKSTYTVDNYFDYNADNDDTQVEGPHSTSTVYVHGFGTDDSYDEEKDKHAYGYGHIDPYLNAKHGYGYSKGYGYEKTYGYGHGGYGSGHGKVNQNIKERKKYLILKKIFQGYGYATPYAAPAPHHAPVYGHNSYDYGHAPAGYGAGYGAPTPFVGNGFRYGYGYAHGYGGH